MQSFEALWNMYCQKRIFDAVLYFPFLVLKQKFSAKRNSQKESLEINDQKNQD